MALSATPRLRIDEMDVMGRTTLSWVCQKGDDTTVAELLSCGADPNITDTWGMSPLHYASFRCSDTSLRLLLTSKAILEVRDRYGYTPLAFAARRNVEGVRILLEFGADMETQDNFGRRPMHLAVMDDRPQNVTHLLHAGADMFARTSSGHTTLELAIECNAYSALRVLLEARELSARPMDDVRPDVDMVSAAWYADQRTLDILYSAVSEGSHLCLGSEIEKNAGAVQVAKWRSSSNQEWSEMILRPRDEDPFAWFLSFESLFGALRGSQSRISEDIDDEIDIQLDYGTGEESSDNGSVGGDDSQLNCGTEEESSDIEGTDATDDEESWEDAPETQGELL